MTLPGIETHQHRSNERLPGAQTYDAIKYLRRKGFRVERLSDRTHKIIPRRKSEDRRVVILMHHEIKAYAELVGWRKAVRA